MMVLSADRPTAQQLRIWWGSGNPPSDAVVLTVDAGDPTLYTGTHQSLSYEVRATWPVLNPAVLSNFHLAFTVRWPGATASQGSSTWQMAETTATSEQFVGFQPMISPGAGGGVGGGNGLETWTASITGGSGGQAGIWTPMAIRLKGMTATDADGLIVDGTKYDTIEKDGWLYAAKNGRPVLYGAIAGSDGSAALRRSAGNAVTTRQLSGNQELLAVVNASRDTRAAIGIQGWEEIDLAGAGTPRIGRFAHVPIVTPTIRVDHGSLSVNDDGTLHVEGDVFDPLEAVSGKEAMLVVVNDTVAETDPLRQRVSPNLSGGAPRRFRVDVPLPRSRMLIWALASNAAGGQAYDRFVIDDGKFSADWTGSRSWGRVSRYRFGAFTANLVLREKEAGWNAFIQVGDDEQQRKQLDVDLAADQAVVTRPFVVTRISERLANRNLLQTLSTDGTAIVEVANLDDDLWVVVEAPEAQRKRWLPDPNLWERTTKGWRRRIEQAGIEIVPESVPSALLGSEQESTNLVFSAKARNLQPGDISVRVGSVALGGIRDHKIGTIAPPSGAEALPAPRQALQTITSEAVPLRLGVNSIGVDIARDSEGRSVAPADELGVYVASSTFPYSPVSGLDVRASVGGEEDRRGGPGEAAQGGKTVASGRVFLVTCKSGVEITDQPLQDFLRKSELIIVGSARLLDEGGNAQNTLWLQVTESMAVAYSEVLRNGSSLFENAGGNEGPSALMTDHARSLEEFLSKRSAWSLMTRKEANEYRDNIRGLNNELLAGQLNTVNLTLRGPVPKLEILDCRYDNGVINQRIFMGASMEEFSNTRVPFENAYTFQLGGITRSGVSGSPYRLVSYQFAGFDRMIEDRRSSASLDPGAMYENESPRVFFGPPTIGSISNLAQRAVVARGVMIVIHGFNNGQGRDGDDVTGIRTNMNESGSPYRMFSNYWPVVEALVRNQKVIGPQVPVIHVWWSGSIDRDMNIFNVARKYPAGAYFNMDMASAHFTGYYKVAPFMTALAGAIIGGNPSSPIPITVLAESLGNRVATSAFDAMKDDASAVQFKEGGMTPLRYLALHPAMRHIDITPSWLGQQSEERERKAGQTVQFTHPYPESPLLSENALLASVDSAQCRTFMAFSSFDKAGVAFMAAQCDNPHTSDRDGARETGMLGRVGPGGNGGLVNGSPYIRAANRQNIAAHQIGLNDGPAGSEGERDYWHVDLWGWALPGQPYRSRTLYGNNLPQSVILGDERHFDNTLSTWVGDFSSDDIAPGLEIETITDTPFWNQIALPAGLVERAWKIPRKLVENGYVAPAP